jgi:hypothetical protein
MYNRRIVISESEKQRILGLHENVKNNEWGTLYEQPSRKDVRQNYREYQKQKGDLQSQMDKLSKQLERQSGKLNIPQKEQINKQIDALKAQMSSLDVKFGYATAPAGTTPDTAAATTPAGPVAGPSATAATDLTTDADKNGILDYLEVKTSTTPATTAATGTADATTTPPTVASTTTTAAPAAPTTKEDIQAFQTWLDGKYPNGWAKSSREGYYYTVGTDPKRGYGNFGTNTKAMWDKLGADYMKEKGTTTPAA